MFDKDAIKFRYPLHYYVWLDDKESLKKHLKSQPKTNVELKDPRGRTALMLAVTLGHKKCAHILLNNKASVNVTDASGFNVLHEAVTTADPEFIRDVYEQKEVQRYSSRVDGIPNLLSKICDTTDFYLEMKWEFTSWVPLISRLCPNDTYKIYKSGSKVRVDTTLIGMDTTNGGIAGTPNWQRGRKSFIFTGSENGAVFLEVDHNEKAIHKRTMKVITQAEIAEFLQPSEEQIVERLTNPISTTFIDTEKIHFERAKSGIIGFRSDRSETVNGYECKVYSANNVELVTKNRAEHLTEEDKSRLKAMESSAVNSLKSWAGIVETKVPSGFEGQEVEEAWRRNPWKLTMLQYFNVKNEAEDGAENGAEEALEEVERSKDIGIPREMTVKTQQFKANLWLAEDFPLSLPEQVLPIVDLMAISSSHFAKLREFIAAKIPVGFPVKVEIPLFHLLNARVTFGNIFATNEAVPGVVTVPGGCTVEESAFEPPSDYQVLGDGPEEAEDGRGGGAFDDDDYMGGYSDAWEAYFNRGGATNAALTNGAARNGATVAPEQVTLLEALKTKQSDLALGDSEMQRAIQLSLLEYQKEQTGKTGPAESGPSVMKSASAVAHSLFSSVKDAAVTAAAAVHRDSNGTATKIDKEIVEEDGFSMISQTTDTTTASTEQTSGPEVPKSPSDEALQRILEASRQEAEAAAAREKEEEEMLAKVLQLSMTDK